MCSDCPLDGKGVQQCIPALEHTESIGVDASRVPITLETLEIDPGFWRAVPDTATILPCWNEDACRGGVTGDANYCGDGYTGPCELEHVQYAIWVLVVHFLSKCCITFLSSECVVDFWFSPFRHFPSCSVPFVLCSLSPRPPQTVRSVQRTTRGH